MRGWSTSGACSGRSSCAMPAMPTRRGGSRRPRSRQPRTGRSARSSPCRRSSACRWSTTARCGASPSRVSSPPPATASPAWTSTPGCGVRGTRPRWVTSPSRGPRSWRASRRNLAAEEFTFLRGCTSRQTKVTLPSPSLFANLWSPQRSVAAYPTLDAFMADVVQVLRDEVAELVRLGCTYIQLDAPHYPLLIDPAWRAFYTERGWSLERWLGYGIELDNAVIDAGRPATFGFHLCRGNQLSRWLVAGGYDAIAAPVFGAIHADRLLLEYDDERSGSFDPLRLVPGDKAVVLGLVTTKTSQVEPLAQIDARLREARSLIDAERLALSP